ncbi:hypothetical protein V8E55_008562 [Tylopilus felleus]
MYMQLKAKFFFNLTALLPLFIATLVQAGPVHRALGEVEGNIRVDKREVVGGGIGVGLECIWFIKLAKLNGNNAFSPPPRPACNPPNVHLAPAVTNNVPNDCLRRRERWKLDRGSFRLAVNQGTREVK